MSYDPIERLKEGNIEFIFRASSADLNNVISRIRSLPNKCDIIQAFLPQTLKRFIRFSFEIIYDIDMFEIETRKILSSKYKNVIDFNVEKFENLLNNTAWGENYIYYNLDSLIKENEMKKIKLLVNYIYSKSESKQRWINKFTKSNDMNKRGIYLLSLVELFPDKFVETFIKNDKIFEYGPKKFEQISLFTERISEEYLSKIIVTCLNSNIDKSVLEKLKNYILTNYEKNNVAELLLKTDSGVKNVNRENMLLENIDELFLTSKRSKIHILNNYSKLLSQDILEKYSNIIRLQKTISENSFSLSSPLSLIYSNELGDKLEKIIDKYLSLSNVNEVNFLECGTLSWTVQIGDYVLKMGKGKYSYEKIICPNLYMILKNLEEIFIRNKFDEVVINIEVQLFLKNNAVGLPRETFELFHRDLLSYGYYTTDPNSIGNTGENFGILDSYKDADCSNPELLPDYFKKLPLVLYDRDLIFKKGQKVKGRRTHFC